MRGFSPTVRSATCAWALDARPYVLTPCPLDGILIQLVPFVERVKWAMIRQLLGSAHTLETVCEAVGGTPHSWSRALLSDRDIALRKVSDFFFAVGLQVKVRLEDRCCGEHVPETVPSTPLTDSPQEAG